MPIWRVFGRRRLILHFQGRFNMYLYFKAFHIISVVAWFAALFYIFRLFVYHVKFKDKPDCAEAYTIMEYKLIYMISHPAMFSTIVFGVLMVLQNPLLLKQGWFHLKLLSMVFLFGYQFFAGYTRRKFAKGNYFLSEKACRIINEVPTILLIIIVVC